MYETRSHGFVTINDVTFPEAVISYGVNDVAYRVERSVISSLTDAATEFTAHFVRHPLGHKSAHLRRTSGTSDICCKVLLRTLLARKLRVRSSCLSGVSILFCAISTHRYHDPACRASIRATLATMGRRALASIWPTDSFGRRGFDVDRQPLVSNERRNASTISFEVSWSAFEVSWSAFESNIPKADLLTTV